jgi:hypothetical protein
LSARFLASWGDRTGHIVIAGILPGVEIGVSALPVVFDNSGVALSLLFGSDISAGRNQHIFSPIRNFV